MSAPVPHTNVNQFDNGDLASIWAKLSSQTPQSWSNLTYGNLGAPAVGTNITTELNAPANTIRFFDSIRITFVTSAVVAVRRMNLSRVYSVLGTTLGVKLSRITQVAALTYDYYFSKFAQEDAIVGTEVTGALGFGTGQGIFSATNAAGTAQFTIKTVIAGLDAGDQISAIHASYIDVSYT